ncbi:Ig-like domain-containing protein [Microbacterium hydrocarbonoxydans]|uniref:Ig-like domain-containing protein n=1 Tax=Microbacterium hydrocarbonoxydans TaxID=273678 RepID=UPI00203C8784|nr:Ig-like domain-containing protein [Microbacterium hydrocarbonoxydans]MCM3778556.1 Ig-like domain-containing protein [Microbacterium hydrocarbonoxydans]
MAVAAGGMLGGVAAPAVAAEPGAAEDHPVTVVLALGTSTPVTDAPEVLRDRAMDQLADLRQYWLDQSDGAVDLRVVSVQWADVDENGTTDQTACNPGGAGRNERVRAAERWLAYQSSPRAHFLYFVVAGCSFGGVGQQPGSIDDPTWIDVEQGGSNPRQDGPIAHELGHNLTLGHAGVYTCADGSVDGLPRSAGGSCTFQEYGDTLDVMGGSLQLVYNDLSTPNQIRLGFLDQPDYLDISGPAEQQVTLQSVNLRQGLRSVQITDPVSGKKYWVEFTTPDGYNVGNWNARSSATWDGVTYRRGYGVRVLTSQPANGTGLLATPAAADGTRSTFWPTGSTFTSASGGVEVNVVSTTSTTATLSIRTRADVVAPAPPASLASDGKRVTGTAEPGATVVVSAPDGTTIGTGVASQDGSFTVDLDPAQADATPLNVTATDTAGNSSPAAAVMTDVPEPPELSLTLAKAEVPQGAQQSATASGFRPGESVSGVMASDPVDLGARIADASGSVSFTWSVPSGTSPGSHTVILTGASSGSVSAVFLVTAASQQASGSAARPGRLAATGGGDASPALLGAGVLMSAGAWLLLRSRRRARRG